MSEGATELAIRAHFDRPGLRRLWRLAADRVRSLGRVGGRVVLRSPSAEERRAVADLLALRTGPCGDVGIRLVSAAAYSRGPNLTFDRCETADQGRPRVRFDQGLVTKRMTAATAFAALGQGQVT